MEFGKYCGQANGSVIVRLGDTVVMVNATASDTPREGQDFFPLSVDFEEKMYSVGKIPGGFIKREGRPSETVSYTHLDVYKRQVHEHANHRRVIVSQNVQLNQYIVHRAEIIVRRNNRTGHVIRRMLDGDELLNLVFLRQNDHACRMLTRRSLDADTAQRKPVHLRFGKRQSALLAVFLNVSVCLLYTSRCV